MKAAGVGAIILTHSTAMAAPNLPAACSNAAVEAQPISACASSAQTFAAALPGSLVRVCNSVSCTYAERTWRKFGDVASTQFVEVCLADKPEGAPLTDCQGTTASSWGAMAMVPPIQVAQAVEAEPTFPGTFSVSPSGGTSPLAVTITWDVSSFVGGTCTASGSWTGVKPLSGSQPVSNLTANAAYTLTCTRPVLGSASLQWTPPTRNTDGSALTNLSGFRIAYGRASAALSSSLDVSASTTAYTVRNLEATTWYFGVRAFTPAGTQSELSNIVEKTVHLETRSATRIVTVTPPQPMPPVLQVTDARVFNAMADYSLLAFRAGRQYGTVPLGTRCDETKPVHGGFFPVPLSAVRWASLARTSYPVAKCIFR